VAQGTLIPVLADLEKHPLGSQNGETWNVPANYKIPPARIYVINHSRVQPWKRVLVAVSARRGAEEALIYDKELAKIYNVDTLTRRIEQGQDMTRYSKPEPKAVIYMIQVGGHKIPVPPAKDKDTPPPRVEVPEGAWDLYLGNYERIRSSDPTISGAEKTRNAVAWRARHNPVMAFTDDATGEAVTEKIPNPYGFLEFVRVTQRAVSETIDKEYLTALDLVE
jgi:hypothetical protein